MSSARFDKLEGVNLTFTNEDKLQAVKIRAASMARFDNDPTSWSARRTLDRAEQIAPAAAVGSSSTSTNVQQAGREAMSALKDALNSIRSKQSASNQHWNESVPPTQEETKIRGTIALDKVNDDISSQPKTAITLNARPLNRQAFEAERKKVCDAAKIPKSDEGFEPHVVISVKAKIKSSVARSEVDDLVALINKMMPKIDDGEDITGGARVENINGVDYFMYSFINLEDDEFDPFEKLMMGVMGSMLEDFTGDPKELSNQAPGLYRLATLRAEFPQSIAEWLQKGDQNWMKLAEASRVSFEAILRRDAQKLLHDALAKQLLSDFDKDDLIGTILLPVGQALAKSTLLNLNMAPPELLYGLLVKEASFFNRRVKETQDIPRKVKRVSDNAEKKYAKFFDTDGVECYSAYHFGGTLFAGITGDLLKSATLCNLSKTIVGAVEDEDAEESNGASIFPQLSKCIAELNSVEVIAHTFKLDVDFEGVDEKIWNFIPGTVGELMDAARPIALANKPEFDVTQPTKDFDDEDDKKVAKRDFRQDKAWPEGPVYEDQAEEICKFIGPGEYLDTDEPQLVISAPKKRNKAFRILVAVNSEDSEKSYLRLLTAFGAQVFESASKKKGGDDDDADSDDDEDEDGDLLPSPTEGYMRVAYVVRQMDGRCIELVRPVSTEEFSTGIASTVDAMVVVDAAEDIAFLQAAFSAGESEDYEGVKCPVLFVSTKTDSASAETNGAVPESLFKPSAVDYKVLPKDASSASSAADSMISWLVSNSANPQRGDRNAEPASAWDFAYNERITIP